VDAPDQIDRYYTNKSAPRRLSVAVFFSIIDCSAQMLTVHHLLCNNEFEAVKKATITGSNVVAGCLRNLLPGSAPISLQ